MLNSDQITCVQTRVLGPCLLPGPQHYLKTYPQRIRELKQQQHTMAGGKVRHFLPWVTACTYGQISAVDVFDSMLHTYGGGATGFSFFIDSCFDDMGKVLALSTATALVRHCTPSFAVCLQQQW